MDVRWALAAAAIAVAAGAGAAVPAGRPAEVAPGTGGPGAGGPAGAGPATDSAADPCELRRADRARTPSQACMHCHDGSAGSAVPFSTRADGHGLSHPVTVDYGSAEARFRGKYKPRGRLPAEVTLVKGRVECTTCHDDASPHPKRVAMGARLCTSCHDL